MPSKFGRRPLPLEKKAADRVSLKMRRETLDQLDALVEHVPIRPKLQKRCPECGHAFAVDNPLAAPAGTRASRSTVLKALIFNAYWTARWNATREYVPPLGPRALATLRRKTAPKKT